VLCETGWQLKEWVAKCVSSMERRGGKDAIGPIQEGEFKVEE
jgi:hypothetical protein